jgi:hypothetical protein
LVEHQGNMGLRATKSRQTQQQDILQKNSGTKPSNAAHAPLGLETDFPQTLIQVFAGGYGRICQRVCLVDAPGQTIEGHCRAWMEEKGD